MEIVVQYLTGCPNVQLVAERLVEAGVDLDEVQFVEVASPEEADRIGFGGSPTVLVDDEDPFAERAPPAGFACRVYRTEAGLEGAPSLAQFRAVLAR